MINEATRETVELLVNSGLPTLTLITMLLIVVGAIVIGWRAVGTMTKQVDATQKQTNNNEALINNIAVTNDGLKDQTALMKELALATRDQGGLLTRMVELIEANARTNRDTSAASQIQVQQLADMSTSFRSIEAGFTQVAQVGEKAVEQVGTIMDDQLQPIKDELARIQWLLNLLLKAQGIEVPEPTSATQPDQTPEEAAMQPLSAGGVKEDRYGK